MKMKRVKGRERGFTLLEYCAGAAIVVSVLWAALSSFGAQMSGLFNAMGSWASARSQEVSGGATK